MSKVEIKIDGASASLKIDGKNIADRVSEYTIVHKAGETPKLYVTFSGIDMSVIEGEALIIIPPNIKAFFKQHGTIE